MNTQALMTRMTPRTLASFIADLDNAPGDYDQATLDLMQDALEALFGLVGRADAMALLSEYDVTASNPLVEAMVEAA